MSLQRSVAPGRTRQHGAGLLEVLIAVLIMGIGMLGVAAMQATALRNSQGALERSQAVVQSYSILDAMRANRDAVVTGSYNTAGLACVAPAAGSLAQTDVRLWITSLKATLGDGAATCGGVNCNGTDCSITVQWDDSRSSDGAAAGSATSQIITRARL
ncbi:type IV pilus modification protein PilV [Stenotrophomonas sp. YIM B06876]|uniref:type IV pilus modification protein PilV n=1 Tax=Stenotrophomonas sp. YIM B06876 TaxID=3060211 RepID=UPI002738979F|nr:type IV pilus modification protein PilV [Stenotrophomonas sp. YIM B06876]